MSFKSFADILKIGLGITEKQDKKLVEARDKGYKKGYADAELRYKVTYPCTKCGKDMEVTSWKEKLVIKQFMKEKAGVIPSVSKGRIEPDLSGNVTFR